MKKINSNSLTSRVSKSSAVRHSVFKRLLKPAIPLVALLSSQTLLASATCEMIRQTILTIGKSLGLGPMVVH